MVLTSHQPNFLPYMGVFFKAAQSDIFVLSDDVQFSKKGMHNWNWILTKDGPRKLTLPVNAHHDSRLADITVHRPDYTLEKIIKTLDQEYRKAARYSDCQDTLHFIAQQEAEGLKMAEFNIGLITHLLERFGIKPKVLTGVNDLELTGNKDERIFQMCEKTGADVYYSGTGAKVYHQEEGYRLRGINLAYSTYKPVVYKQMHEPFAPNMSVIDYIFNCGYDLPDSWGMKGG